jgi:hypothetical protein
MMGAEKNNLLLSVEFVYIGRFEASEIGVICFLGFIAAVVVVFLS